MGRNQLRLDGAVAEALGKNQAKSFLMGPQHGIAISEAMYEMCAAFGGCTAIQSDGNTAPLDAADASYGVRRPLTIGSVALRHRRLWR